MKSLLKHTLNSIKSNIAEMLVIILTVAVVTVMTFASFSMSDVFYNVNMIENERLAQGADMLIGSADGSAETFSKSRVENVLNKNPEDIKTVEYFLKFTSVIKKDEEIKTCFVEATDINEYFENHEVEYIDYIQNKTGVPSVIIGNNFSDNFGLKCGDIIELYIVGFDEYIPMMVTCIAKNEGIFKSITNQNILIDISSVGDYGLVNAVYVTFTNPDCISDYQTKINSVLPQIDCKNIRSNTEVEDIVKNNTTLFSIGIAFIIATMMVILFTSYLIIARNRTKEMIIFKASGATPFQTAVIMLMEVVLYALVGWLLGLAGGRFGMSIAVKQLLPNVTNVIKYDWWKYIASGLVSVVVTVLSTIVPIVKISKKTVRAMTSEGEKIAKKGNLKLFVAISILAIISIIVTNFVSGILLIVLALLDIILIVCWIAFSIPFVLKLVTTLSTKISSTGGMGLSSLTVKRNKALHSVTTLVAVIIAFSFMVVEIVGVVKYAVTPYANRYIADAVINITEPISDNEKNLLHNNLYVDGVESVDILNYTCFIIPEEEKTLSSDEDDFATYGITSGEALLRCCSGGLSENAIELWNNTENPIVLSEDMLLRLGVKVGDTLTLHPNTIDYTHLEYTFTVVGVDYTITRYDRVAYAKYEKVNLLSERNIVLINYTDDAVDGAVFGDLLTTTENLEIEKCFLLTYDEYNSAMDDGISGILGLLSILQYMVLSVGVVGIINITVVTLCDRNSELSLYNLCGMDRKTYYRFALSEAGQIAISGGTIGIVVGETLNVLLPIFTKIVDKYINYPIISVVPLIITLAGMVITVVVWMLTAFTKRKEVVKINSRFS